ncbi:MAG TPA: hypothetical protein PKN32_10630 [Bacteroidales bacterium]|nr:hypothetical protein [Bacteroidales bacterium]
MHKIYEGKLQNQGSESFRFTIKDFKRVQAVFCSGGVNLSLAFDNGKKVLLHGFEFSKNTDCPPNKRPVIFSEAIEMEIISGVISGTMGKDSSVYLILE